MNFFLFLYFYFFKLIKRIKDRIYYPGGFDKSNVNDHYEVVFKSGFLTIEKAIESTAKVWGTNIYCENSNLLRGILYEISRFKFIY